MAGTPLVPPQLPFLKDCAGQIGMLIPAKNRRGVSAGADRHREAALRGGNSRHLPSAYNRIFNRVHAAADFLPRPNGRSYT